MANEKRLIDADELEAKMEKRIAYLRKEYGDYDHYTDGYCEALDRVEDASTVDAAEVVHGHWAPVKYNAHCSCGKSYETYHYLCSACNRIAYAQPYVLTYCPNCGAKMDGDPLLPSRYSNGRSSGE